MKSLNGNLLCAVDTETTGLAAGYHEITELAVVPLDGHLHPIALGYQYRFSCFRPFVVQIKPAHIDRIDSPHLTEERLAHLLKHGTDASEAVDLFEKWVRDLELAGKIAPLGHNYAFDRAFLQQWMGVKLYEHYIDYHTRDSQVAATFLNDRDALAGRPLTFPHTNLKGLCETLGVENKSAHSALSDALACAECYRLMLKAEALDTASRNQR